MVAGEAVAGSLTMITIDRDGGEGTVTDGNRTVTVELCDDHDGCIVLWLGADAAKSWALDILQERALEILDAVGLPWGEP